MMQMPLVISPSGATLLTMSFWKRLFDCMKPQRPSTPELACGDAIPNVSQINQNEEPINLHAYGASGYLLVYFYPKADTPGCTKQSCSLRDAERELTGQGVKILGVSVDTPAAQAAFKEKFSLPFDLLADKDHKVIDAFRVPTTIGYSARQAYLFKDGQLIWKDATASTREQAADVLEVISHKD